MLSLPTVYQRRLQEAVPARSAWLEAWGFLLLGVGVYLALACYSYSPFDYTLKGLNPRGVGNLAGPYGAIAASHILGRFGIVGMAWPVVFMIWGALTATGFVVVPKPSRFLGFLAITATLSGFADVQLPRTTLPEPSFGFGGVIGHMIKMSLLPQLSYGGTMIALAVLGLISLVLTGNLTMSKTATACKYTVYLARKTARKASKFLIHWLWYRLVLNQDPYKKTNRTTQSGFISQKSGRDSTENDGNRSAKSSKSGAGFEHSSRADHGSQSAPEPKGIELELFYNGPSHGKPGFGLFSKTKKAPDRAADFKLIGEKLTKQLSEFKIEGQVKAITQGPVVTTFEFLPAAGTKVSKISALGEDLARLLKAQSLRVLAPIPGKDTVGFEVPNTERAIIGFSELIDSKEFKMQKRRLPIAMGVDIFGEPIIEDLAEMPHLLVAGSTGSGKSVFMNTLIGSLISRHSARDLRMILIDPKMVEMAAYNDLPHLACPVVTDPQNDAKVVLNGLVTEMDDRYNRMRELGARNVDGYNDVIRKRKRTDFPRFDGKWQTMPYIVLIIDELADMMMLLGKDAETPITRIAQKARAAGIHMVIATQRPSADVVTGLIKANFPTRVAFRVMSGIDSRTILDQSGAETLLGKGDMLYLASGGTRRLHGAYLNESEVQSMVKACSNGKPRRK
jgi:S-DNA-T family DNA segregation ATPase FtsK/SpoIIIE